MENVLKYYEFSSFFEDKSGSFSGNEICFSELNATHFLVFERENLKHNLYVSKYSHRKDIGVNTPEILELVIENYNKSIPSHRVMLRKYLD